MNIIKALGSVRKILGKLTDLLIKGREAGLWQKKPSVTDVFKDELRGK